MFKKAEYEVIYKEKLTRNLSLKRGISMVKLMKNTDPNENEEDKAIRDDEPDQFETEAK